MKSQAIRKRNLPSDVVVDHRIQLKPTVPLVLMAMAGMIFVVAKPYLVLIGLVMCMLAVFCLFVMPEGILCEFTSRYLILYNRKDRSDCMLVYWEDIVSWQYEWHTYADLLVIMLVDGSTEIQEVYSSRVRRYMKKYAPNKEVRSRTRRLV